MTPLIDPEKVTATFDACRWRPEDAEEPITAEGIASAQFASMRLAEHREEIAAMLDGLPTEFKRSGGGGWSFLNGCVDANGDQWTELQQVVEQLFLLGMAINRVTCQLPREMWAVLPGGVPYYVVEDTNGDRP